MANHFSVLENSMKNMERPKDMTLKEEASRSVDIQYATGEEQKIAPEKMNRLSQSGNEVQLWMCLMVKVNSDVIKNNIP